jgi:acyl-CoA synthetase (AMP-forming)/AMP-acid ligase II
LHRVVPGTTDGLAAVLLGGDPSAPAVVAGEDVLTRAELGERARDLVAGFALPARSLVVLGMTNSLDAVATYLGLLDAGHVPLLTGNHEDALAAAWDADAVVRTADGLTVERRRSAPAARTMHPELALLLSTSGSTGAPKLVRLSHENLRANAAAIAEYLHLTPDDRAITSLPLHYCYGLSVLHSHLLAGASVALTTASVVDPCFAATMRTAGVTNVAGVPHTFELLERAGPEIVHVPTLRFLTQAGGRMAPDRVRAWAARCASWGAELYVMYGQTEATARMAYLPPELAAAHPEAIGRPIPGGSFELCPVPDEPAGVGELVYRGPNVMLGYATAPEDLALGATLDELRTGDLARYDADADVYVIVGRRARFVKPFGLRIDLERLEAALAELGHVAVVTGDDDGVVIGLPEAAAEDAAGVAAHVVALAGLPAGAVHVDTGPTPRTANGKVDYDALRRRARAAAAAAPTGTDAGDAGTARSVGALYAAVLGRHDVGPASTFVSLGGDSLSYVECSVRLEELLGRLPSDWHLRPVAELDAIAAAGPSRRRLARLDTTALLRAVGVSLIVCTHMFLWYFPGGAHLLLAVVGYNTSRFHLPIEDRRARALAIARSIARVAVPVVAFVGICMLLVGGYGAPTLALVNNYLGPVTHQRGRWHYWFVEVMVQLLVVVAVLLSIGPVRRAERRFPYLFPLALFAGALVLREHWVAIGGYPNLRFQTHGVAWFFLLGWLVHRSTTVWSKLLTSALCVLTVPGFFNRPEREWFIVAGVVLLIWCREIPMPRRVAQLVALVASASMAIFISHFRVFPPLDRNLPRGLAFVLTLAIGVAIWVVAEQVQRVVRTRLVARRRDAAPASAAPTPTPADALA